MWSKLIQQILGTWCGHPIVKYNTYTKKNSQ